MQQIQPTLHEIKPSTVHTFQFGDNPELVHFLKLGYKDLWARVYEDGYGQDPWLNGLKVMSTQDILDTFKVNLNNQ